MSPNSEYYIVEPCATSNAYEIKTEGKRFDLEKASRMIEKEGALLGYSSVVLSGSFRHYSISLYASGRAMIKGGTRKLDRSQAENIAAELIHLLEEYEAVI